MQIVDRFSFAGADALLAKKFSDELVEVETAIAAIDGESCKVKLCREGKRKGQLIYSPIAINYCLLNKQLYRQGWDNKAIRKQTIRTDFPVTGISRRIPLSMDGIKNRVGLESQLGKYAFLEYDVLAKMPIYAKLGLIEVGIEVIPIFALRCEMSSGVGDFERLVANLTHRGFHADDFPVLVLGIGLDPVGTVRVKTVAFEGEIPPRLLGNPPGPSTS